MHEKFLRAQDMLVIRAELGDRYAKDAVKALDVLKSTPPDGSKKERAITEVAVLGLMTNPPSGKG